MENWILDFLEQFGYLGVFLLIALENVFPPIPSEVILTFGGFMTTYTRLSVLGVVVAATAGSVAGAIILYGLGRLLDAERLEMLVDRWGHILRVKNKDIRQAELWFKKYGHWAVLFGRMIPLVRSLVSIPAGMSHMNFWIFLFFTVIGTLTWNVVLVLLGAALGRSWTSILGFMDIYSNVTYAFLGLGAVIAILWLIRRNGRKR